MVASQQTVDRRDLQPRWSATQSTFELPFEVMRRAALLLLRRTGACATTSSRTACLASTSCLVDSDASHANFSRSASLLQQRFESVVPATGDGSATAGSAGPAPPPSLPPAVLDLTSLQDFQAVLQLSSRVAVILQVREYASDRIHSSCRLVWTSPSGAGPLQAHANWCGPCKQLTPVLQAAVEQTAGAVVLARMDIDSPDLAPLVQQMQARTAVHNQALHPALTIRYSRSQH